MLQRYEYNPRRHHGFIRIQKANRKAVQVDDILVDLGDIDRLIARELGMPMEEVKIKRLDDPAGWRDLQMQAAAKYASRNIQRTPMSSETSTSWPEYIKCLLMVSAIVGSFGLWMLATPFSRIGALLLGVVFGVCLKKLWRTK